MDSPYLGEAKIRAAALLLTLFPELGVPTRIFYCPRTYIVNARDLFALDQHD